MQARVILHVLPILQIMLRTVGNMVLEEGTAAQRWLGMIGSSTIALLTGISLPTWLSVDKMDGRWRSADRFSTHPSPMLLYRFYYG